MGGELGNCALFLTVEIGFGGYINWPESGSNAVPCRLVLLLDHLRTYLLATWDSASSNRSRQHRPEKNVVDNNVFEPPVFRPSNLGEKFCEVQHQRCHPRSGRLRHLGRIG